MSIQITPTAGLFFSNQITPGMATMVSTPALIDGDLVTQFGINAHIVDSSSVGIDLGTAQTVDYFHLWDTGALSGVLTHGIIIVLGSNNNSNWTQVGASLDIPGVGTGITHSGTTTTITPTVTNAAYRYWRIYFSGAMGPSSGYYTFTELQAFTSPPVVPTNVTLSITSEATIVNPYVFTFEDRLSSSVPGVFISRETESSAAEWHQQNLREAALTQTCNHLVNNMQYVLGNCPRCLGQGTYHDIIFDAAGQVVQVFGADKLQQELEKIILTQLGDNQFHTEYGLPQMVDLKTRQLITFIRDRILENISNIQQYQWIATKQNPENNVITELINSIDSIDIVEDPNEPSRVSYTIYIRTESARAILLQGQINIS